MIVPRLGSIAIAFVSLGIWLSLCASAGPQLGGRAARQLGTVDSAATLSRSLAVDGSRSDAVTAQCAADEKAEADIHRSLATPVGADFADRGLDEVLAYLSTASGTPIQIDAKALEDASIGRDTPVTCNFSPVSLRSALTLILRRMDLTWTIQNEVVLVTTPEKAGNLMITKVYPVQDLILWRDDGRLIERYDQIIETITTIASPTTWGEVGGPGSIHEFHASGALVVSQTREVHEEIFVLLVALRRTRDMQHLTDEPPVMRSSALRAAAAPGVANEPARSSEPARYVVTPSAKWAVPQTHE